jgi:hypothetical protein
LVKHIVMFRLIDRTPESVGRAAAVLRGLAGKVPTLRRLEVGADVLRSDRSWDIALVAAFDSLADLEAYQVHPEHQTVVRYMNSVRESVASVDFETV